MCLGATVARSAVDGAAGERRATDGSVATRRNDETGGRHPRPSRALTGVRYFRTVSFFWLVNDGERSW